MGLIRITRKNAKYFLMGGLLVAVMVLLCVALIPLLEAVARNIGNEEVMVSRIAEYGSGGAFVLMGLHIIQVVTMFFPSGAIQILAGLCYGTWLAVLICYVGYMLGNIIVFTSVRLLGNAVRPYIEKKEQKGSAIFARIKNTDRPELYAFLLYLIPGIPNGFLPYFFATTKITLPRFLMSISAGCIPAIILCAFLGDKLSGGNFTVILILFGVIAVLSVVVVLLRKKIVAALDRRVARDNRESPKEK